ncbi:MAG: gluconate 2-dehydrogenase subunit 3 family protein [Deltaproteobacteria bacterium]|nr:gluconate 2-dehydrogenase subunit 3 family protein [Deltaproteobacteria bacterium]
MEIAGSTKALALVTTQLRRRQVLGLLAAGTAAALLPLPLARAVGRGAPGATTDAWLLTEEELAILDAATARIVPSDSLGVGARECGVVTYIRAMLAFAPGTDANCDRYVTAADLTATVAQANGAQGNCRDAGDVDGDGIIDASDITRAETAVFNARPILAGGPFSGRQPQPHFPTGATPCVSCHVVPAPAGAAASGRVAATTVLSYPPEFFRQFLPLSRLQALSWKIRMLGAAAVPAAAANPLATTLLETDMRRRYREGLASLEAISRDIFGKPFAELATDEQGTVLDQADIDFVTLLRYHTIEGMLCAPEYGGNRDRRGWQLIGFDGDSQPLGYTIYDESIPGYRERSEKPNSGPNPEEDCRGFSANIKQFLGAISSVTGGRTFDAPYCFEVPA